MRGAQQWTAFAERGSRLGIRVMAGIYRVLGRKVCRWMLAPVAAYFAATDRATRRASRDYLATVARLPEGRAALGGEPPGFREVVRHLHEFAVNLFDRMVAWGGGLGAIDFQHTGSEHLFRLAREGRGGILVGSHLGSFDMMRLLAGRYGLTINVLMFTEHAERLNAFFEELDPSSRVRVIRIDPRSLRTAFEVKACLARGEFVGILADRPDQGGRERAHLTRFLGREALFPLRPFLLAALFGAPLLLAVCVRQGESRYFAAVEPLWEERDVKRGERDACARALAEQYVRRLEAWCLEAPFQWFNFYDFWEPARLAGARA